MKQLVPYIHPKKASPSIKYLMPYVDSRPNHVPGKGCSFTQSPKRRSCRKNTTGQIDQQCELTDKLRCRLAKVISQKKAAPRVSNRNPLKKQGCKFVVSPKRSACVRDTTSNRISKRCSMSPKNRCVLLRRK
jgi:hypothetical protein